MGIGTIADGTPGYLGMIGMHGSGAANRAMHDSDAVLACGVRFDDRATGLIRKFCPDAKIIHIDIDAAEVNKIIPATLSVIADAESAIPVLAELIDELDADSADAAARERWMAKVSKIRAADDAAYARRAAKRADEGLFDPGAFIGSVPGILAAAGIDPSTAFVTTDVGQHQMWTAQHYPCTRARQFLTSGSLGTMGFGLPAAIGAALANPGHRVICFSGDGSIMMNIQELATLAEEWLDVTVIVLDNGALGMVRQQQELLFAGNYSACIYRKSADLCAIARGFGIPSFEADDAEWKSGSFGGSGPRFVHVRINQDENVYPFVPAGKANIEAIRG
jgi:acetolactate synthase-1/2/3 large subunit